MWIGFALAVTGMGGLFFFAGVEELSGIAFVAWTLVNSFVLIAIPMFLFMGEVVLRSGLGERFYGGLSVWLQRIPGGLTQTNIAACSIFAAISGSSVATAATIGTVAVPSMKQYGYPKTLIYGSLAAGGTLGILIPPSISMIVYGAWTENSVGRLFMAGFMPGIMIALMFMLFIAIYSSTRLRGLMPSVEVGTSWKVKACGLVNILPIVVMMVLVLGGIYSGLTTPTEAAALGACAALLLSLVYRTLSLKNVVQALSASARTTAWILFIMFAASILQFGLVSTGVTRALVAFVIDLGLESILLLSAIIVMYMILGCFIDGLSMVLLTLPLVYPVVVAAGFDPIWFGVIIVIYMELAMITPPVGLNLFVIHGIASGDATLGEIARACAPYWFLLVLGTVFLILQPQIALWLPNTLLGILK